MTRILLFGDLHFKIDNILQMKQYMFQVDYWIKYNHIPDVFILLGDILHYHERLHTAALNQFYDSFSMIRKYNRPIIILVGNHDMINHKQYLTTNHWMNVLKNIPNVYIIDSTQLFHIDSFTFGCVPYVPNGTFKDAIQMVQHHWEYQHHSFIRVEEPLHPNVDMYFAHQEFKGCCMGFISSETGDEWDESLPRVLSGHIHQKQILNNIYYVGSAIQSGSYGGEYGLFSELCIHDVQIAKNTSHVLKHESLFLETYLHLHFYKVSIPQHIVKTYSIEKCTEELNHLIDLSLQKDICESLKINVKSSIEDFKLFKQTNTYKTLQKYNIHITLKPIEIQTQIHKEHVEIPYFLKEIEDILKSSEHSNILLDLFQKCLH